MPPTSYGSLAEAAELIRTKKLFPVEYVTALLARIERYDAKYNAFIALTPERALTAARAAEAEIAAGRWRGPFHGMPYALKDIIDVEGLATTAHSKILRGNTARRHAVVTERGPYSEMGEASPAPRGAMAILAFVFAATWFVTGAMAAQMLRAPGEARNTAIAAMSSG